MRPDHPRLGFCCKFIPPDGDPVLARAMNQVTVTMAHLGRLGSSAAHDKIIDIAAHNLAALHLQIRHVAGRPPLERVLRVTSSLLPAYNHDIYGPFYRRAELRELVAEGLADAGAAAREGGVRLSMHPSQFCVIASQSPAAARNGIAEFEYHADVLAMMGYGGGWHPHGAHINIHGGARSMGPEGFRKGLARLSQRAQNLITVENDEVSYSLDDLLPLAGTLPIVLDLHHHWIASRGEYIEPDDPRVARIIDSWRGVRPLSHVSVSKESLLDGHDPDSLPDFASLVARGIKPRDLRSHSDMMWNRAVNKLVARHLAWSDFEIEAKMKNLASEQVAEHVSRPAEQESASVA